MKLNNKYTRETDVSYLYLQCCLLKHARILAKRRFLPLFVGRVRSYLTARATVPSWQIARFKAVVWVTRHGCQSIMMIYCHLKGARPMPCRLGAWRFVGLFAAKCTSNTWARGAAALLLSTLWRVFCFPSFVASPYSFCILFFRLLSCVFCFPLSLSLSCFRSLFFILPSSTCSFAFFFSCILFFPFLVLSCLVLSLLIVCPMLYI